MPLGKQLVKDYVTFHVDRSEKTQAQIAMESGFDKRNMITMLKKGHTKVPPDKAPALAASLEVEAGELLELVFREYQPEVWEVIEKELLKQPRLTRDEIELIKTLRAVGLNVAAFLSRWPPAQAVGQAR